MNEPIQDKAPKPPGLLPKHVQSWLILSLAVLMVVIMWLTSPKKPQTPAKSNTSVAQAPAPLQINETQIAELQSRIEELQRQDLSADQLDELVRAIRHGALPGVLKRGAFRSGLAYSASPRSPPAVRFPPPLLPLHTVPLRSGSQLCRGPARRVRVPPAGRRSVPTAPRPAPRGS